MKRGGGSMKTDLAAAVGQFPALRSPGALLAARCALEWYELTAEGAAEMFTEDCVYENRCDQGTLVKGPAEICELLELYRSMCDRFEGVLLNILEADGIVLLEREEITHLKDGRSFSLPIMDSFQIREGKIASFREYWDLALLTQHLDGSATGDDATRAFQEYKDGAGDTTESGP
jgi:limonene-1,2-epoxide hydrolase